MLTTVVNTLGWVGAVLLGGCAAPASHKAYVDGHTRGMAGLFIASWFVGELLTLTYVLLATQNPPTALIANYSINLALLSVIVYYSLWPRDERQTAQQPRNINSLYPKWHCLRCSYWFHLPEKRCQCKDIDWSTVSEWRGTE